MSSPWLKNGKKVSISGSPVLCNRCPCDEECISRVDSLVLQLTQQGWQVSSTRIANFTCAEWQYSEQTQSYVLVSPAQGELIIALPHATAPDFLSPAIMLVYGVSLYNATLNRWRVVGCQCEVSQIDYTCNRNFVDILDYDLAGVVPVYSIDESDSETVYTPADSCRGDDCEILKRRITSCTVYNATLNGTLYPSTGFFSWWTGASHLLPANFSYTPFLVAYKYTLDNTDYIAYVNCACTDIFTAQISLDTAIVLADVACDSASDFCIEELMLRDMAQREGWTLKGEGLLIHKATCGQTVGNWFEMSASVASLAVIASEGIYMLSCNCKNQSTGNILFQDTSQYPSGYWDWLEYEGACDCVDWRELILAYPEKFGLIDVSYGNNTKYRATTGGSTTVGLVGHRISNANGYFDMFLDYRTLCFIVKEYDSNCNVANVLYAISPSNSPEYPYNGVVARAESIVFAGLAQPFSYDADLDWHWTGRRVTWVTAFQQGPPDESCTVMSGEYSGDPPPCLADVHHTALCGLTEEFQLLATTEIPLVATPVYDELLACDRICEVADGHYSMRGAQYFLGALLITLDWWSSDAIYGIVYNVQWVQTNKGILLPDGTLQSTFVVRGLADNWCRGGAPRYDTTYTATMIDDDMHGCHDFDWQMSDSE